MSLAVCPSVRLNFKTTMSRWYFTTVFGLFFVVFMLSCLLSCLSPSCHLMSLVKGRVACRDFTLIGDLHLKLGLLERENAVLLVCVFSSS